MIGFRANGLPVTEGSTKAFIRGKLPNGKPRVVVVHDNAPDLERWRGIVAIKARQAMAQQGPEQGITFPLTGPVAVQFTFYLARPVDHYGTGRNAGKLKPSAPEWPTKKPDLDKLERAVFDALTEAGAIEDDARIVRSTTEKLYVSRPDASPGVVVDFRPYG